MAQSFQAFCALLVEETCGHLPSKIFSILATHGRLNRRRLASIAHIDGRKLKHALTVLIKYHTLLHYTTDDDITFYQVDWRNTTSLLRSNRITQLVRDRYGEAAGSIVTKILEPGHTTVGDLASAFNLTTSSKRDSGVDCIDHANGTSTVNGGHSEPTQEVQDKTEIKTISQLHVQLRILLGARLVSKLNERAFIPAADLQVEVEEEVKKESFPDGKITGTKKQERFQAAVNQLKRKWRDDEDYSAHHDLVSNGITKHSAPTNSTGSKRIKLNGAIANGVESVPKHNLIEETEESLPLLPNDLVLRMNYSQINVALRSSRIEALAERHFGNATAAVYAALLRVLESKIQARIESINSVQNDDDDDDNEDEDRDKPKATTLEVSEYLDSSIELMASIKDASEICKPSKTNSKKRKRADAEDDNDETSTQPGIKNGTHSGSDDGDSSTRHSAYHDPNFRLTLIDQYLENLAEHPKGFCRRVGNSGHGEWIVDFSTLSDNLIQAETENTILSRFGQIHTRIVRMLREKGKLDDKQIAALLIMRIKDVRSILTELQFAGVVESQELPRDAQRQPTKSLYLWSYDRGRMQDIQLQRTYQTMVRALQRLRVERHKYRNAIEKVEILQVKEEALNKTERDTLALWHTIEDKIMGQVRRLDEFVMVLRDFDEADHSLDS